MHDIQREDWRIRPLSPEMVQYARTDAHYLLYIANCLVSELQRKTHCMNFFFITRTAAFVLFIELFRLNNWIVSLVTYDQLGRMSAYRVFGVNIGIGFGE